ncbi:NUDIX domain-containing protein [Paenibacillus sediminis]|uniref:8-oxo-dGTP pyrophosphatase MutT (NUDIX family) n=1 Tax=Paenibacillus sediminis TaxID=664909 RepID=A0ABS4GYQ0_9BACL|nr:NUDIX domain-containing protein [Paenibacillus sediminis]MBP1935384.1 8-oxo-dGTP pyrophosphatase MutT (NUDIX family) [Paenibacillus sediminis]
MKEISAGGVVYRKHNGKIEIQLITDRYGKISLAKGKMEAGETVEQTALREISEETGMIGRIIEPVEVIAYTYEHPVHGSVNKEVHYFLVEAESGELKPQIEEIRGVNWYSPEEAWAKQTRSGYDNNDAVLRKALHLLGIDVSS